MPVPSHGEPEQLHQRTSALPHSHTTTLAHTHTAHKNTYAPIVKVSYIHKEHTDLVDAMDTAMETGRTPYCFNPQVVEDRQTRESLYITPADYGKRWRATFRVLTGDAPQCRPGDHAAARMYWLRVRDARERGGWSPSERASLYRAEKLWGRRAEGREPRFEVMGTIGGRPDREQRMEMERYQVMVNMRKIVKGEL
jgi:hypothetical protein